MSSSSSEENSSSKGSMDDHHSSIETKDSSNLLELAANNDFESFDRSIDRNPAAADEAGLWYGRKKGLNQMVLQQRTPLMVAATYGSLDVLKLILSVCSINVNRACGDDETTALHCTASGGSENAAEAVKLLLLAGADIGSIDANGHRPADVIIVSPKLIGIRIELEGLLGSSNSSGNDDNDVMPINVKLRDRPSDKKEYPIIDSSLPDIKNSVYATDEFRMFLFKVRPCSRAYSHDWTECPFVHPGENARRRDPRKFHYSCVPCPDFRKGTCRRGDMCEYAHGVFECWLHPAQYRTRLCKDGIGCARRVCFFAHANEELRPLYASTGSAMPSPRSPASVVNMMDFAGHMPGSPSSFSAAMSPFTLPLSPPPISGGLAWPQPHVPALHLPGGNLQSSRLRSSLNARDMLADDFAMMDDFEAQRLLNDLCFSRLNSATGNCSARSRTLNPANLDELFSGEMCLSPRYISEQGGVFSPSHRSAMFSPKSMEQLPGHPSLFSASLGFPSPGRMSPRNVEPVSPMCSHLASFGQREKQQQMRSLSSRDLSPRASEIVVSSIESSWKNWGSPSGTPDWVMDGESAGLRSSSVDLRYGGTKPDVSWVHSLVKESPTEKPVATPTMVMTTSVGTSASVPSATGDGSNSKAHLDGHDNVAVMMAWLDQMQLDQMVA